MSTPVADQQPAVAENVGRTEVCDPQISVSALISDVFKDLRSKHAVIQLVKLSLIMMVTPWLLTYVAAYYDWSTDMWAKTSLVGVNFVIAAFVLLAWREDQQDREEEEDKKTR